jgi:hypothetical protein
VRALGALTNLDRVREHALDAIKPRDQVARSGWVGFRQQIGFDLLVGGDLMLTMTRHAAAGAVDSAGIEPKQMLMGLARKSAMLSGKMTPLGEAIELHEEPWIFPYLAHQLSEV